MESVAWSISVRMRWRAARSRGSEQQQRRRAAYVVKELKTFTDKIYAKYLPYIIIIETIGRNTVLLIRARVGLRNK